MQTVRQAFTILKQNPLLSTISILGTAFAITMIMAIVITWQTKYADLEPEVNRSRCLYFSAMHVYDKEKDGNNNWSNPSAAFYERMRAAGARSGILYGIFPSRFVVGFVD